MKPIIRWTLALALWLACTAAVAVAHCFLMVVILVMALWATAASGQTAVITGPSEAVAGYPVRFYIGNSEGTTYEWAVIPSWATPGLSPDDNGRSLAFSVPNNGDFALLLLVDRQAVAVHTLTLVDGEPGPPEPPSPPAPPPVDLSAYVERLTKEVSAKADEFGEVSQIFFTLAGRISKGELRGSKAIVVATTEALLGTEGDIQRTNWRAWHRALMGYLLNNMNLVSPDQWADAYKTIGEAVK